MGMTGENVADLRTELSQLEDPGLRAANERRGDDHGINLTALRSIAKRLKKQPELARELWATHETGLQLLAVLISSPRQYDSAQLDRMLREARAPKVREWFVNYVAKKSPHAEELRVSWLGADDPLVRSAGWALTSDRVVKNPDGIDLRGLLDAIELSMKTAPDPLQWQMNACLAQIGIMHPEHRTRAITIGERLEVLKDYPTPPGCTSPYAPTWIGEIVARRRDG
ncbi:3-methyladenine DNA glycosylase AlkD [Paramicrobacterium agarici]|uniref:3-methyladenine DNA glycosylase AlkD n=2 Tax=Paramicrobacterium agarici TaxID=630514 RepID=A0A2A9DXB9_9MICO|nr:3-methyladenine DNA glycosylase AlkD [Microbacterium agarici]